MKKQIIVVATLALTVAIMAGCQTTTGKEQDTLTNTSTENSSSTTNSTSTAIISEDEAKQIAADHAGVNINDATSLSISLDQDNNSSEYDIEFVVNGTEYDYEIDASTGAVLKNSFETADDNASSSSTNTSQSDYIGNDKAIEIALDHANTPDASPFASLDSDDGIAIYEIEWKIDGIEYEYEINATTGEIIQFEHDVD